MVMTSMRRNFTKITIVLCGLLVVVSLYDLFAPPLSSTSWRQTQTAMLTDNFVKAGFSVNGLYVNILGRSKPLMVYEFPIYNFIVGVLFVLGGNHYIWGKLVSLIASIITLCFLIRLVRRHYSERIAVGAALFFIFTPVAVLMRTSFQPDALSLMFLVIGLELLLAWRENHKLTTLSIFSFALLLSGLAKFPVLVSYIPFIAGLFVVQKRRSKAVGFLDVSVVLVVFVVPFVLWYLYAKGLTYKPFVENANSMFLIGNLARFVQPSYYVKPAFIFFFYVFSGLGLLYFIISLRGLKSFEVALLLGIPLYLVLVPTSSAQDYYQLATTPIAALFMAKGFWRLSDLFAGRARVAFLAASVAVYSAIFLVSSQYLLRQDKTFLLAARNLDRLTRKHDLVVSLVLHDRVYVGATDYTEMLYMAGRSGWDVLYNRGTSHRELVRRIDSYKAQGAMYLVVTWYSKSLEPWFVDFVPHQFARNPHLDGKLVFKMLSGDFTQVYKGRNFAILSLGKGE